MRVVVLLVAAGAWCPDGYTCCCRFANLFPKGSTPGIPHDCECVETTPSTSHTETCARDGNRSTPNVLSELVSGDGARESLLHGLCRDANKVSSEDLKQQDAWQKNFQESCTENGAQCSEKEHCWYDGKRPGGTHQDADAIGPGAQCVCSYPRGRDAHGRCVQCPHDDCNGRPCQDPAFVPGTPGKGPPGWPGVKIYENGEFHCQLAQDRTVVV